MCFGPTPRRRSERTGPRLSNFLVEELKLELKPAYINTTAHGMDFLGCRRLLDAHDAQSSLTRTLPAEAACPRKRFSGWDDRRVDLAAASHGPGGVHADERRLELAISEEGDRLSMVSGQGSPNRVIRGGSWNNTADNTRASNRNRNTPENRNNNLGFRVARAQPSRVDSRRTGPTALPSRRPLRRANRRSWPPGAGSRTRTLPAAIHSHADRSRPSRRGR